MNISLSVHFRPLRAMCFGLGALLFTTIQTAQAQGLPPEAQSFLEKHKSDASDVPGKIRRSNLFAKKWRKAKRRLRSFRGRRHIIVNIPEQMLYARNYRGQIEFTSKVIIGKAHTPTPTQRTRILTGKFSPAWTAPTSIGFENLDRRVNGGLMIRSYNYKEYWQPTQRTEDLFEADMVDITNIQTGENKNITARDLISGRYYFYIPPGNTGPLGPLKFVLHRSQGIYLHGTTKKELFDQNTRLESHGCVRVEHIEDLAAWVYRKPRSWVDDEIAKEEEHYVRIRGRKVPVYFTYFLQTDWNNEGLQNHEDVYKALDAAPRRITRRKRRAKRKRSRSRRYRRHRRLKRKYRRRRRRGGSV